MGQVPNHKHKQRKDQQSDHHHDHHHDHSHGTHIHPISRNLTIAFLLNLVFSIIEFAGGIWSSSIAVLSDAVHDFGDTTAIGLALILEKYSRKGRDQLFSYGYGRFSVLSAFLTATFLAIGSILILIHAVQSMILQDLAVHVEAMLALAVVGVLFNGLAVLSLRGGESLNQKAVLYHLMEDLLGWIAVLIGSVIIYFTEFYWLDPALAIGVSLFILYRVVALIRNVSKIFLQSVPEGINLEDIEAGLLDFSGVQEVHDLHAWSLDGKLNVLSVHVALDQNIKTMKQSDQLKKEVIDFLHEHGIHHSTIQFDVSPENCELVDC